MSACQTHDITGNESSQVYKPLCKVKSHPRDLWIDDLIDLMGREINWTVIEVF